MNARRLVLALIGVLATVGIPLAGHRARQARPSTCALDGGRIETAYRVRIIVPLKEPLKFCCIRCAVNWLEHGGGEPLVVFVTDEPTGTELDANDAHYVTSSVVTTIATLNRTHVFRDRGEAERHAEHFRGRILEGSERPLHAWSRERRLPEPP